MNLIETLKDEHKKILELFDEVDSVDAVKEKKILVEKLKKLAIKHLTTEGKEIYPKIKEAKEKDIRDLGELFSELMNKYSTEFLNIIKKIEESHNEIEKEIIEKYSRIKDRIKDRIVLEETTLFPAYEKL